MDRDDLIRMATQKAIGILAECGLKYRKRDFVREQSEWITTTEGYARARETITILLNGNITLKAYFEDYENGSRGKKLKKEIDKFYNYFNANVHQDGIAFTFTKKELEIEIVQDNSDEGKIELVMKKIQKLLALAESANEHEALSASLKAQKLLAKYNLDLEQVDGEVDQDIEEAKMNVTTGNTWKADLAVIIANSYRCKFYVLTDNIYVFRGYRADVLVARRVFAYLFSVGKRLGKDFQSTNSATRNAYSSYCWGFVVGIRMELEKQCTALALICPKKVEEDWKELSKSLESIKRKATRLVDRDAYYKGKLDGIRALNAQFIECTD